jgi:DNA adenine methylase
MQAPFPYFGGKSRIASAVWERFGTVRNYVEPFFGTGAVMLLRPQPFTGTETVNDADGMISNFWRAISADPEAVAFHADNPVNENDLHARHSWLVERKPELQARLEGDPEFYDAKVAGWWCWGICCWIGSGFCSGKGPWRSVDVDGVRQLVHLGDAGRGVNRQRVHLGDAGRGVNRQRVHLGDAGKGVNRKRVHLGDAGQGVNRQREGLYDWFDELSERLRRVRVCCGDWSRVCTNTPTVNMGETAVFLDPPYADTAKRAGDLYSHDSLSVAHDVRAWAIENGERMRVALCGYEGEHAMPADWEALAWKTKGGYGSQGSQGSQVSINASRERIWFSPRCQAKNPQQLQSELALT